VDRSKQFPKHFFVRRRGHELFLAVLFLVAAPALTTAQAAASPPEFCTAAQLADSARVGQYVFRTYDSGDGACLQVSQNGKILFRRAHDGTQQYTLGQPADGGNDIPAVANGADVTGRGLPDMIVSSFTGGAHCCTAHLVFELEPAFKLLATLDDAHDDLAHFARIGADRRYYYLTADWTFAYWPSCFACSPSAAVILRFVEDANGGGFHLALDKMQAPAPTPAAWDKEIRAARSAASAGRLDDIGAALWGPVLNLIYQGHSDLAWKLVDEAGPKAQQKPMPALADFCRLLKTGTYWPDLAPTLRNTPPACAGALSQISKQP
jgi:hypothetical protein